MGGLVSEWVVGEWVGGSGWVDRWVNEWVNG